MGSTVRSVVLAVSLVTCFGCADPQPAPSTVQARAMIDGWSKAGMYLPDRSQVEYFQTHLDEMTLLLASALANENQSVRMRAAYVIEKCRPASPALAKLLVARVSSEENRLVRIYLYNALCVHAVGSIEAAAVLRDRWNSLDKEAIVPVEPSEQSAAYEAIHVAGALSVCEKDEAARSEFASDVLRWLNPPPTDLPRDQVEAYWDLRWSALAALRSMPPTDGAIPLLEAMLEEHDSKPWVAAQVPPTLVAQGQVAGDRGGPAKPASPFTTQGRLGKANEKLAEASSKQERFYALNDAAKESFVAGKVEDARKYANELMALLPKYQGDWNYGNAVQDANLVLGRIAVTEGRIDEAKQHLLAAGKSPGSPQMNSFGPNMSLAKDLLEKGERDVVIEYFELCHKFWKSHSAQLDEWRHDVLAGKIPDFGANLDY